MQRTTSVLFIFLLLSTAFSSFAQGFRAGVSAGVNASQVSGDGYSGFRKAGLLIGLYSNVDVSEKLNLQFEINYSEKGSRKNPKTDDGDTDFFLMRMNYIEIPILLRFKKKRFTYEAGAYFSQLVSDYLEDENGRFDIPPQLNQFKNNDYGLLIGLNFNFTDHLIMNWRFNNSIVPFREYDSGEQFQFDAGMFHHYISFTFRYEFLGSNEE